MKSITNLLVSSLCLTLLCLTTSSLAVNPFQFISKMITKPSNFTSEELGSITQSIISELSDDPKTCTYVNTEEHTYDFNPLADKIAEFEDSDTIYKANFCSDLENCTASYRGEDVKGSICAFSKHSGSVSVLGSFLHEPLPKYKQEDTDGDIHVEFENGVCNPFTCTLHLYLKCSSSTTPVITKVNSAPFMYSMHISTRRACLNAGEDSISSGTIFIIILLSSITLYFVIGMIVNKFLFRKSGLDLIPNHSFWIALPSLVVAGLKFIINPCKKKDNYSNVGDSYGTNDS